VIDQHSIGRLLLETGKIEKADYSAAMKESKRTGKSLHELLLHSGKMSVDELVQAITIHMDITLLKEALGIQIGPGGVKGAPRPLGSYLERISLLFKMGILMSGQTSIGSLVDLLIREAPSVMNAERATIFLADHETEELFVHLGVGVLHDQIRIPWDSGIAGWVYTHGEPLNIVDPYDDPRFNRSADSKTGFLTKSILCVPLQSPGGPILGVFQVLNKRAGVFTSTDLEILEILASQAARSIENALEWDHVRKNANWSSQEAEGLKRALTVREPLDEIIGTTRVMQDVRSLIQKVAPTKTTVLIQGESGTGKELVARSVHQLSSRADNPMISLNCAAVPSELIESELFGHKRGSFTGAVADHQGLFRSAHMGTLFLDEIEAMSPAMQVKLLRSLQAGEIKPVGETASCTVNVRLITATNQDLGKLMSSGEFREDLFYRINVFPITIPPLRDRVEDIPTLIRHCLERLSGQTGKAVKGVDPAVMNLLLRYPWPGNVRELENEIERAHVITPERSNISVRCLSSRITQSVEEIIGTKHRDEPVTLKEAVEGLEKKMIAEMLAECNGNKSVASKRLGLSRQGLINKIHKFGFEEI
jgi:Nif-specific regulatory protein